ncbi:MAG: hypothetical protein IPG95_12200 [Saprospiraceae bacterium]|nr:hypothetical protein [Saprospiraceae bacterium]
MALFDTIKSWFSKPSKSNSQIDGIDYQDTRFSEIENQQPVNQANHSGQEGSGSSEFLEKAKDFVADSVDEAKEQGKHLWSEIKEKIEILDDSTREFRENIVEKAKEGLEKMDHFIDETVEKAKKLDAHENLKDQNNDGIADKPIDFGKNLESTHPDFFSKAEKWLETQKDHTAVDQKNLEPSESKQKTITPVELPDDTKTN